MAHKTFQRGQASYLRSLRDPSCYKDNVTHIKNQTSFLKLVRVSVEYYMNQMLEATDNTMLDKGGKKDSADKKKKEAKF